MFNTEAVHNAGAPKEKKLTIVSFTPDEVKALFDLVNGASASSSNAEFLVATDLAHALIQKLK